MAAPCDLCGAAVAPYTCPRCNRRLCSLGCYRGHGSCGEAFYREQVLQALDAERDSRPGRGRVASALRRQHSLREAGDEARPAGRGLWEQLSEAERDEFRRLLNSGDAAALLPPWRPWWWRRRRVSGDTEDDPEDPPAAPPPPPAALPPLRSLRAAPLAPTLPFQVPNALYGYSFALTLHGGDEALVPEIPAAAVAVSAALRRPPVDFGSVSEALGAARVAAVTAGYPRGPLGDAGAVLAVAELLEGGGRGGERSYAALALGHLEALLRGGSRRSPPGRGRETFAAARRKCRFLASWSAEPEARECLAAMAREARRVYGQVATESGRVATESDGLDGGFGGVDSESNGVATEKRGLASEDGKMATEGRGLASEFGQLATKSSGLASEDGRMATKSSRVATESTGLATDFGGLATEFSRLATGIRTRRPLIQELD